MANSRLIKSNSAFFVALLVVSIPNLAPNAVHAS